MATRDKHSDSYTSRIEKVLEGIQKKTTEIGSIVRGIYDCVAEMAETTDSIHDLVTYHRESKTYGLTHDDLLDE